MKTGFNIVAALGIIFVLMLTLGVFIAGWERPPMKSQQIGYRGTGMQQITNPRKLQRQLAAVTMPSDYPPAEAGGRKATEAYQNVQVLGSLSEEEMNRIMTVITEWVSPDEGCGYCHNLENLADDSKPTKLIARRMFQMTRHINEAWTPHVAQTGVTCFTCHRGKPVPSVWFQQGKPGPSKGMAGYDAGQNHPALSAGLTALPNDPFSGAVDKSAEELRVVGKTPLPVGQGASIKKAEAIYALMMHMSEALGVNCTFCHNTRSFFAWEQSVPARVPAFQGIQMVRDLNEHFVIPLKPLYAKDRLGPQGDTPKLNCATCHRGVSKPLGGVQMLKDYPELKAATLEPPASMQPATVPAPK